MHSDRVAALPFSALLLVAYVTVLLAEGVGDKTVYTVASLALRFPRVLVFAAMTMAFAGKMLTAVLLGKLLFHVFSRWTAPVSAGALFTSALFIWFEKPVRDRPQLPAPTAWSRAAIVSFASIFFTEWGDPGQVAAAGLAVAPQAWLATWLGATLAMMTKGGLAMTVGLKLRSWMPDRVLRIMAAGSCCLLGLLALRGLVWP